MSDDNPPHLTYRDAGLDLDLYEKSLACMPPLLKRTHTPRVLDGFGGFASLFSLDYNSRLFAKNYRRPVLVSCTDGVGSKLKVASLVGKHDTVGIDLVGMSVNDCLCTGGEPLLFLDYLAMPKDDPALTRDLIKGISDGCMEAECSLVGGETAILPDFYAPGDYDMAGFCVGVVEKDRIISGKAIRPSDVVNILQHYPVKRRVVRGLAHITGGGLVDNLPRILPPGRRIFLKRGWPAPPVFPWLQRLGNIEQKEMDQVFNGGIGFAVIVSSYYAESVQRRLCEDRMPTYVIGEVREGEPGVEIVG